MRAIQWETEEIKKDRDKVLFQFQKKELECGSLKVEWYWLYTQCVYVFTSILSLPLPLSPSPLPPPSLPLSLSHAVTSVKKAWSDWGRGSTERQRRSAKPSQGNTPSRTGYNIWKWGWVNGCLWQQCAYLWALIIRAHVHVSIWHVCVNIKFGTQCHVIHTCHFLRYCM